jgi:molybdate/tungstate transport system permease protein
MKGDAVLLLGAAVAAAYASLLLILPLLLVGPTIGVEALRAILNSALFALASAALCLLPAALVAYATMNAKGSPLFPLVSFSTAVPHTALGALLLPLAKALGIIDTGAAVLLAMFTVSLPLATVTLRSTFLALGPGLEQMLKPLGLGRLSVFAMYLRAAPSGLLLAALVAWLRAFSELGALLLIAFRPITAGIYVYEAFYAMGLGPVVGASLLMGGMGLLLASSLLLFEQRFARRHA